MQNEECFVAHCVIQTSSFFILPSSFVNASVPPWFISASLFCYLVRLSCHCAIASR